MTRAEQLRQYALLSAPPTAPDWRAAAFDLANRLSESSAELARMRCAALQDAQDLHNLRAELVETRAQLARARSSFGSADSDAHRLLVAIAPLVRVACEIDPSMRVEVAA